jgi:hypothetical protein
MQPCELFACFALVSIPVSQRALFPRGCPHAIVRGQPHSYDSAEWVQRRTSPRLWLACQVNKRACRCVSQLHKFTDICHIPPNTTSNYSFAEVAWWRWGPECLWRASTRDTWSTLRCQGNRFATPPPPPLPRCRRPHAYTCALAHTAHVHSLVCVHLHTQHLTTFSSSPARPTRTLKCATSCSSLSSCKYFPVRQA